MVFIILISFEFLSFLFHSVVANSLCQSGALYIHNFALLAGDSTSIEPVLLLLLRTSKHHLRPPELFLCSLSLPCAKVELSLDPIDLLPGLLLAQLNLLDLSKLLVKLEKKFGILRLLGSRGLLQVLYVLAVLLKQRVLAWREIGIVLKDF